MLCALLTSRYQVSVYRTNGPLVYKCSYMFLYLIVSHRLLAAENQSVCCILLNFFFTCID